MEIRNFKKSDLVNVESMQPEGWAPISSFYQFYLEQEFCFPICAVQEEELIGVANNILFNDSGWLSHIIVNEKYRNQGIGRLLTERLMEMLDAEKCYRKLLIATTLGKYVYEKLGFQDSCLYKLYSTESGDVLKAGTDITRDNLSIREADCVDYKAILEFDKKITGEDRSRYLLLFMKNGVITEANELINGYYLPECGEGLIVTDNDAAAELLVRERAKTRNKFIFPEPNRNAVRIITELGLREVSSMSRMFHGEDVNVDYRAIYNRIGGFCG